MADKPSDAIRKKLQRRGEKYMQKLHTVVEPPSISTQKSERFKKKLRMRD